jgi:hypothetical protein
MNVELLRKVAARIQAKPESFNMRYFIHKNFCITTRCIAGEAAVIYDSSLANCSDPGTLSSAAVKALDITYYESYLLFFAGNWPKEFQGSPDVSSPTIQQIVARIEHFIATHGTE